MPPLVLASRSPQRRAILEQLGVRFTVRPSDVEEDEDGAPEAVALGNALRKARATGSEPGELVLAVDTVVATEDAIHGKPADADAARATLRALGGRTHRVVSGVALRRGDEIARSFTATTAVTFRPLGDGLVEWYVATGEWAGRAGGYAIQGRGAALVRSIEGDYLNVVGLPVAALLDAWPALLADSA